MGVFENCFDPQALTSLTMPQGTRVAGTCGFDPQALTSLTKKQGYQVETFISFDPQALTSLTKCMGFSRANDDVSIHRLLRA